MLIYFVIDSASGVTKFADLKNPQQSSTYSSNWPASLGIDGSMASFSATKNEDDPWWRVDIGDLHYVHEVTILKKTFLFVKIAFRTNIHIYIHNLLHQIFMPGNYKSKGTRWCN